MQKIDREKFFDSYRDAFGSLAQSQVDGLELLLSFMEADEKLTDLRHAAYMFATVRRECGADFHPVKEVSRGKGLPYGKADPVTGQIYFGRGYTQITWKANYQTFGKVLNLDLLNNPDLALEPLNAYHIMSYGMRNGAFTGVSLKRFIHDDVCDYLNARKIINGLDVAELVARYAVKFETILRAAA